MLAGIVFTVLSTNLPASDWLKDRDFSSREISGANRAVGKRRCAECLPATELFSNSPLELTCVNLSRRC